MTQKHTPGPWRTRELSGNDHRGMGWVEDANGNDIACFGAKELWLEENRANARLIAAAPELLVALEIILPLARGFVAVQPLGGANRRDIEQAAATIAKATGNARLNLGGYYSCRDLYDMKGTIKC